MVMSSWNNMKAKEYGLLKARRNNFGIDLLKVAIILFSISCVKIERLSLICIKGVTCVMKRRNG